MTSLAPWATMHSDGSYTAAATSRGDAAIESYLPEYLSDYLRGAVDTRDALHYLTSLYYRLGHADHLNDFRELPFAITDLEDYGQQVCWSVTRENIQDHVRQAAEAWLTAHAASAGPGRSDPPRG